MNLLELIEICIAVIIIVFTICLSVSFINTFLNERKEKAIELKEREIEIMEKANAQMQEQVIIATQMMPLVKMIERIQK